MEGSWWELKIQLDGTEYVKLKELAAKQNKDLNKFVHEIIVRFLETL